MGRFTASQGPLRFAAASGARAVLLCFDIDEAAGAGLIQDLVGFAIRRESVGKAAAETEWFGDPRRGKWRTDRSDAAPSSASVVVDAREDEPEQASSATEQGGGWHRAIRCAIQAFKWGDYAVEPDSEYVYTLCAVCGDTALGVQDSSVSAGPPAQGPGLHVAAQVQLKVRTPPLHGRTHEVHFNRGVAGSQRFARLAAGSREAGPRAPEQWKWLSRGLEEALIQFIEQASGPGWGLYCAFYEAFYPPVLRALAQARQRGATLQLVMDWKRAAWSEDKKAWTQRGPQHLNYWALAESGLLDSGCVTHRTRPLSAISHNKFIVLVSPSGCAEAVWTGSTNLTPGAIFGHTNVGHVLREPELCKQYLAYWEKLKEDPEKQEFAAFNERLSPLPSDATGSSWKSLALFSPRLRWADTLSFIAQLILQARHSVAFTAAFGIGREISPALLSAARQGAGVPVPTYLLLESEGNWQASKDAVRELRRKANVRVAFGMHMEEAPAPTARGGWIPEQLTGLNEHVKYVHTKILLIDMFSDNPIVISGSANFSRASMESNDENMMLVRGNTELADAYGVEFFRIFEHMRYRNEVQGSLMKGAASKAAAAPGDVLPVMCKCGQAVAERTVKKPGPNTGRRFRGCANPPSQACGYFAWVDPQPAEQEPKEEDLPWPRRAFHQNCFDKLERQLLGGLCTTARPAQDLVRPPAAAASGAREEDAESEESETFQSLDSGAMLEVMLEVMEAVGLRERDEPFRDCLDAETLPGPTQPQAGGASGSAYASALMEVPWPVGPHGSGSVENLLPSLSAAGRESLTAAKNVAQTLLTVESNSKGGTVRYRELRDQLVGLVRALPDDVGVREPALQALSDMDISFMAKTKATWRPQLRQALDLLSQPL